MPNLEIKDSGNVYPSVRELSLKKDPSSTAQSLKTKFFMYGDHIVVLALSAANAPGSVTN